jgi:hypothetical protein
MLPRIGTGASSPAESPARLLFQKWSETDPDGQQPFAVHPVAQALPETASSRAEEPTRMPGAGPPRAGESAAEIPAQANADDANLCRRCWSLPN